MAVHLTSDIVADVMRNADPARRLVATNKLQSAAAPVGVDFAVYSDSLQTRSGRVSEREAGTVTGREGATHSGDDAGAFRDFERLFLHSLFETLLPKDESGSFGSGPSAGVWRSMTAEHLAGVYAESGGVGIEEMLSRSAGKAEMRREAQWPYFALRSIDGFRG